MPNDTLPPGALYFPGFLSARDQAGLLALVKEIVAEAPYYVPQMPRTGRRFSVAMTNCGPLGWVSDKCGGYRYQAGHPVTGRPWPAMPNQIEELWDRLVDYPARPEACLINLYRGKARLGSHVDRDEVDLVAPVVSISLGDDGLFHIGGPRRSDPKVRLILSSGDALVLGGPARLAHHGLDRIVPGTSDVVPGGGRINLTLRHVGAP